MLRLLITINVTEYLLSTDYRYYKYLLTSKYLLSAGLLEVVSIELLTNQ